MFACNGGVLLILNNSEALLLCFESFLEILRSSYSKSLARLHQFFLCWLVAISLACDIEAACKPSLTFLFDAALPHSAVVNGLQVRTLAVLCKKKFVIVVYSTLLHASLHLASLVYPILLYPILLYPILLYSTLSYSILFYFVLSYSNPNLLYPFLLNPTLSYPTLSYSILPHTALFCSILLYPTLYLQERRQIVCLQCNRFHSKRTASQHESNHSLGDTASSTLRWHSSVSLLKGRLESKSTAEMAPILFL